MDERLTETELRAWRSLMSAKVRLLERLDHELQQRSGISLTDFEILTTLSQAPERRVRMSELADRVLVSRSRLTYRVDRLVHMGYLDREECRDDRRGLYASLTPRGDQARIEATPGHVRDIRTWFLNDLGPNDLDSLWSIMSRIDEKLAAN